jgi:hypothetical protein
VPRVRLPARSAGLDRLRSPHPGAAQVAWTILGDAMQLRIPTVLAFTVLGTAAAVTTASCGGDAKPTIDAGSCTVVCVYQSTDNGHCPFPTCATGSDHDQCPSGCIPEPVV